MPTNIIPSFLFYCFITGITPGPANISSLYAGITFGRTKALKQWTGLFTGFFVVAIASVLLTYFVGAIFTEYVKYFAFLGAAYLIYMAIHIILPGKSATTEETTKIGFLTGLFINCTNVKIMIFCFTSLTTFVLPYNQNFLTILLVGLFLPFTGPTCNLVWLFAGVQLNQFFTNHKKIVNIVMALSLVYCAISLLLI